LFCIYIGMVNVVLGLKCIKLKSVMEAI